MSRETEQSEGPSTLPAPEVNPLLNPLLAENMGRWAQVYFTSPPEKREQAVQELLRKLEGEHSIRAGTGVAAPSSIPPSSITEQGSEPVLPPASRGPNEQSTPVRCHACGRKNPSSQRFCGMCGSRLGEEGAIADLHRDDPRGQDLHLADLHVEDQHIENPPQDEPASLVQNQESQFVRSDHSVYETRLNTNELSLFQSGRDVDYSHEDDSDEILSTPGGSGSSRIYLGIVLAIIIGAVAYMAWRSAQARSQTSHVEVQAPAADSDQPTPTSPSSSKTDTPDRALSADNQPAGPSRDSAEPVRNAASPRAGKTVHGAAQRTPIPEKNLPVEASAGTGAEELAVAQRYLNGTNGQGRNSAEAAKWLWKAIAKDNGEATLVLSDLYLKGDGVSKNCDQARVLLDSAAIKGVKSAGERLRHLQAFGCQ